MLLCRSYSGSLIVVGGGRVGAIIACSGRRSGDLAHGAPGGRLLSPQRPPAGNGGVVGVARVRNVIVVIIAATASATAIVEASCSGGLLVLLMGGRARGAAGRGVDRREEWGPKRQSPLLLSSLRDRQLHLPTTLKKRHSVESILSRDGRDNSAAFAAPYEGNESAGGEIVNVERVGVTLLDEPHRHKHIVRVRGELRR